MRKYIYIFKSELMSNLQYVFNILVGFVGYFIMLFIFLNLWNYIYDDPTQIINGYTKNQMIWYVIITEILWMSLGGRGLCKKICNDVRTGNIAYNINKPYSYVLYSVSNNLGEFAIKFIIYVVLGMLMGFIFMGEFPNLNILSIICVLISSITSDVSPSAIGDMIYGYIMLFISGVTIPKFILFTVFSISGGIIVTCISVILSSLSFWFSKSDIIADKGNSIMTNFATYPDGIFKGIVKILLFTIIPVGIANYIPVRIMTEFNILLFLIIILVTIIFIILSFIIFYKGLKRYSSSNLMVARI